MSAAALARVQAFCAAPAVAPAQPALYIVPRGRRRVLPPFRASCARGHEPVSFAGPAGADAFEDHMRQEHPRGRAAGGPDFFPRYALPEWLNGKPYPWVAPRPSSPEVFARKLAAWGHEVEVSSV